MESSRKLYILNLMMKQSVSVAYPYLHNVVRGRFQTLRGYGDVERRMLPLILSWAVTVHNLQGITLEKAVIDLGKKNFVKGQIYVALSCVKSLEGIALSDFDANSDNESNT